MTTQVLNMAMVQQRLLWPGALLAVGIVLLVGSVLVSTSTAVSVILVLIGGGSLAGGVLLVVPTPALLVALNGLVACILLLQGLGLCHARCGGFVDYQQLLGISTSFLGMAFHVVLAVIGSLRRAVIPMSGYRAGLAMGQGASLYFMIIMITHWHWCPACATAHAIMVAQAMLLWRLTPDPAQRLVWGLSVVVMALGVNAVFHHRYERSELGPGEALLGWMQRQAGTQTLGVAVEDRGGRLGSSPNLERTNGQDALSGTARGQHPFGDGHGATDPSSADDRRQTRRIANGLHGDRATPAQALTLAEHGVLRHGDFYRYGDPTAPITVRAHMSLVCPGCRLEWPKLDAIRPLVNARTVNIEFIFTWPIKPETNAGAQMATYVLYTAGLQGDDELMAAGDRLYSGDGYNLITKAQEAMSAEEQNGVNPLATRKDALIQLFRFCGPIVPASRAIDSYTRCKSDLDAYITKSVSWLAQYGDLATPHFYFVRTGAPDGPAYLDTTTMDQDVWKAFAAKGVQAGAQ